MNADQIRTAIAEAMRLNGDGLTTEEIADALGVSAETARAKMKVLMRAGALQYAGQRTGLRMDGRASQVPVYRLVAS